MNQQRLQSYINLIQKLLACPSGEEWILLRQNEALVTPELVQVMEQVATQLANQGNLKEAKFLHNLAGQIHHLFVAQTVQRSEEDDQSEAYLQLIQSLLACPKGSEGELLAANQELIDPGLVHMMQQVAAQLAAKGDLETANYLQHWATELNRLWLQQHNFQTILKPEPEPKHPNSPLGTVRFTPSQVKSSPSTPVPQSKPPAPPEDEQDIWAELSEAPVQPEAPAQPQPQPLPIPEQPLVEPLTPAPELVPAPSQDLSNYEQITRHLETIAGALTKLSETLTSPTQPPPDPLWYMEVLERAYAGNWVLTSAEIQKLIGVQPTCPKGSDSFQRGCWIFVKAGKLGTQTGWRVTKESDGIRTQG
ncbi:hypothetical protein [Leptodesmis sichuanensis]|uniref:hypothetical protein n=1 Tax=Leptodesmis sichuanensis TaxID=2906798 RepID=UPI001F2A0989|nr:hypothetical protein [Leptodesmis sichuanensis]UIE40173.1 hypothetical protein KIK02_11920 [Leptodesmis sichuanensis A121]